MTTLKRKTSTGYENLGLGGIPRPASALNGKPLKWDDTNSVVADATADLNAAYQPLNLEGTLSARPAANSVPAKSVYFATDDNGGTLYRSNGTAWAQLSPGVTAANGYEIPGTYVENVSGTTQAIAAGGNADVTNLANSIPATARPVWMEISVRCSVTGVTGTPNPTTESATLVLYETTSGSVAVESWASPVPSGSTASQGFVLRGKVRLGSSIASTRTFKANVIAPGNSTNGYPIVVSNGAAARSWMAAFAA